MVDEPNSRMKVARTAGTFSIPRIRQSWPSLVMYSGFLSGPCSGAEKRLQALGTLILSSRTSCLVQGTSYLRLTILLLLEVQRRRDKLVYQTFPCTRMLAPHSVPGLPMKLCCPGRRLRMISMSLESIRTHESPQRAARVSASSERSSLSWLLVKACFEQAPLPALAHHTQV